MALKPVTKTLPPNNRFVKGPGLLNPNENALPDNAQSVFRDANAAVDLPQRDPNFQGLPDTPEVAQVAQNQFTTPAREAVATTPEAVTQDVAGEQLVENRLGGLLQSQSPFLRQARQQGLLESRRRGFEADSSIAASAAAGAAIDRALPIASQDAATFQRQALANQDALNTASNLSAQLSTNVDLANTDSANRFALQEDAQGFRLDELQQQAANALQLTESEFKNRVALANLSQDFELSSADEALRRQMGLNKQQFIFQQSLISDEFSNKLEIQQTQNVFDETMQTLRGTQAKDIERIRGETESGLLGERTQAEKDLLSQRTASDIQLQRERSEQANVLEQIRADNQQLLQTSGEANVLSRTKITEIANLLNNPNIPNSEINSRIARFKAELGLLNAANTLTGGAFTNPVTTPPVVVDPGRGADIPPP